MRRNIRKLTELLHIYFSLLFPPVSITPFFSYLIRSATLTLVQKYPFITAHDTNERSLSHEILLMLICWIHPMIATTGDAATAASVYIERNFVCLLWETRARSLPHKHTYTHENIYHAPCSSRFNLLLSLIQTQTGNWKIPAPTDVAPPFWKSSFDALLSTNTRLYLNIFYVPILFSVW